MRCYIAIAFFALSVGAADAQEVARYSTEDFTLALGSNGTITELLEKETGRNLLRWKGKFARVVLQDGREVKCGTVVRNPDGRLELSFEDISGLAVLSVREERWGLVLTAERLTVPDVKEFTFFIVYPVCRKYNGQMMNAMSDDESAVVLRTYELTAAMRNRGNTVLEAVAEIAEHPKGAMPARAAFVVAPRSKILDRMKEMSRDAGALSSRCGGAWSLAAPENRESYIIASMARESAEDWIALAERGGFRTISLYNWWNTLGHYETNTNRYPRGDADLKETIDMIHAAGFKAGMHTLTAGIEFNDSWIKPECHSDLLVTYAYTLAKPFADGDEEMAVNEKPGPKHHLVTSFLSNGNILRIGGELFTYSGIKGDTPPYAFTGVKRGAYHTKRIGTIPSGTRVEYLFQHFFSFFPEPSSRFMDEMAGRLANIYSRFGFDFVYHDGAEPMSRYNVDLTRRKFVLPLDQSRHPLQVEASVGGAHSWWFHSRIGAWDHVHWAAKRFHDYHLRNVRSEAIQANMLAGQAGWWSFVKANGKVRGSFTDEAEYFASRNAGEDLAMSLDDVGVTKGPLAFSIERQMTILGWYERFRLARAFTDDAVLRMKEEGSEFRLRQNPSGEWELTPVVCRVHRAGTPDSRPWVFDSSAAGRGAIRVEALYSPSSVGGDALFGPADADALAITTADKVKASVRRVVDSEKGDVLSICAENSSTNRYGAWMGARLDYSYPFRNIAKNGSGTAFGFWVKGDGSGAVLDFRISSSRVHGGGQSDHFTTLDFIGWRQVRVLLRERDADRYSDYGWPGYRPIYPLYRNFVDPARIEKVEFFLNDVPAGGRVEAVVSPVRILSERKMAMRNVAVAVNGVRHEVPFALESGEYAELEETEWTRYSEAGEPMEQSAALNPVMVNEGKNACCLETDDDAVRAEVTVFAFGKPMPALKPMAALSEESRNILSYEAVAPVVYAPSKGLDRPFPVTMRPGEAARLEFEIMGPVKEPMLTVHPQAGKPESARFETSLAEGERLMCRDGATWKVVKGFRTVRTGSVSRPLPDFAGCCQIEVTSADPMSAHARINVIKRYRSRLRRLGR